MYIYISSTVRNIYGASHQSAALIYLRTLVGYCVYLGVLQLVIRAVMGIQRWAASLLPDAGAMPGRHPIPAMPASLSRECILNNVITHLFNLVFRLMKMKCVWASEELLVVGVPCLGHPSPAPVYSIWMFALS